VFGPPWWKLTHEKWIGAAGIRGKLSKRLVAQSDPDRNRLDAQGTPAVGEHRPDWTSQRRDGWRK